MKPYKYFENIIKDRSKERDTDISDELAKREVDTIFFLLKKFYGIVFTGTTNTVVDIGCGDGYLGKFFEKRGFSYKGYDIDDLDIEKDRVNLEDNSVDIVINIGLIEALENIENLIK